jgi:ferredoxin like protein
VNEMGVPEKLAVNKYELDEESHIAIDQEVCRRVCRSKTCLFICPAQVYTEQNGQVVADHAGCLECGTCLVACPHEALHWKYPRGGFGIVYRYA